MLHNIHILRDKRLYKSSLHYESYLVPGDKVDVVVLLHGLLDPLGEHFGEALVNFEPCSVETQTQRSSVGLVMAVEVMAQKPGKLFLVVDV